MINMIHAHYTVCGIDVNFRLKSAVLDIFFREHILIRNLHL